MSSCNDPSCGDNSCDCTHAFCPCKDPEGSRVFENKEKEPAVTFPNTKPFWDALDKENAMKNNDKKVLLAKDIPIGTKTPNGHYEVIGYATNAGDQVIVVQNSEGLIKSWNVNDLNFFLPKEDALKELREPKKDSNKKYFEDYSDDKKNLLIELQDNHLEKYHNEIRDLAAELEKEINGNKALREGYNKLKEDYENEHDRAMTYMNGLMGANQEIGRLKKENERLEKENERLDMNAEKQGNIIISLRDELKELKEQKPVEGDGGYQAKYEALRAEYERLEKRFVSLCTRVDSAKTVLGHHW